jgi:hypothetical protein
MLHNNDYEQSNNQIYIILITIQAGDILACRPISGDSVPVRT